MAANKIKPEQLCVGLYIQLDLPWMKHSFMSNKFKIKNEDQIKELKSLGLTAIAYDPSRSDAKPLPLAPVEAPPQEPTEDDKRNEEMWRKKQERIEKLKDRRVSLNKCEKDYKKAVGTVRKVMSDLRSQPAVAVEAAGEMVNEMVSDLMVDQDAAMHLVNMKGASESSYYHSINVTLLSLVLGKQLGLDERQMNLLGIGALLHDLGHTEVPDRILRKAAPLTKAEEDLYQMHPIYGEKIAKRIGTIPPQAIEIILQHHEFRDGTGYPKGLKGDQISRLAQVVSLVNRYDNLCNRVDVSKSSSPYEAMAILYAKEKVKFDEEMIAVFITNMGVYPPGTVVKLSDERIGAVMSINTKDLLNPNVMVYDPDIPMTEALILNLKEEGLKVSECIRRTDVPDEVKDYLSLGDSVNFFFDIKTQK